MGRGAPKGRRGGAAVLRGGPAAGDGGACAVCATGVAAGDGGACAVCATGRRICVRATGRGGAVRGGNSSRGGSVAAVLARGSGFRAAFLRTGVQSRRAMRCPCGQRRPCAGEWFARGVGRGGSCAGERLARGVPADRGSVSTGHAVSLRTARPLRGETTSARRSCGQWPGRNGPCAGKQLPRGHRAPRPCLRPRPGKKWPATALCQSPAIFPASVCGRARGYVRACSCATGCSCPAASSF